MKERNEIKMMRYGQQNRNGSIAIALYTLLYTVGMGYAWGSSVILWVDLVFCLFCNLPNAVNCFASVCSVAAASTSSSSTSSFYFSRALWKRAELAGRCKLHCKAI